MRRIQMRRGHALPAGAKYVGRGSRCGNPFRIGSPVEGRELDGWHWLQDGRMVDGSKVEVYDRKAAVVAYGVWLAQQLRQDPQFLEPLRDKVLACYCPVEIGLPCHADAILDWFEAHPVRPPEGQRAVFGLHRQVADDAETAPAWPSLPSIAGRRAAAFARWARGRA